MFNAAQVDGFDETKITKQPASVEDLSEDQRIEAAETFFAARAQPTPALSSAGSKAQGVSVADKGFAGDHPHTHWREWVRRLGARLIPF